MTLQNRPSRPAAPRSTLRSGDGGWRSGLSTGQLRSLGLATLAGALAGLVAWLLIAVPVLVAWFVDSLSTVAAWQALGVAAGGWALAHRGVVDATELSVQLTPLLLTALPVLLCRYAARYVLTEDATGSRPAAIGGFSAAWHAVRANHLIAFVLGYVAGGFVICFGSELGPAPASFWLTLPGLIMVPLVGIVLALVREHRQVENPTIARAIRWLTGRIPVLARRGLRPAGEALSGVLVASLLVVVALVAVRGERVGALYAALDAGYVGVVVLTVGQLLLLPNLVVWALGWVVGAGVSIGTVHTGWDATTTGDLPLIPVLGALPEPGPVLGGVWIAGLVPVLAGAWLGFRGARSAPRLASWWTKAQVALAACAWLAAIVLLLSWLAAGSVTPGLLGTVGTDPFVVTGALLAEVLTGAGVVVTGMHLLRRRL